MFAHLADELVDSEHGLRVVPILPPLHSVLLAQDHFVKLDVIIVKERVGDSNDEDQADTFSRQSLKHFTSCCQQEYTILAFSERLIIIFEEFLECLGLVSRLNEQFHMM